MNTLDLYMFERHRQGNSLPPLSSSDLEDARWIRARTAANALGLHSLIEALIKRDVISAGDLLNTLSNSAAYEQKQRLFELNEPIARSDYFMHSGGAEATSTLGREARLSPADKLLEVGIGCGAEARQLFAEFGCAVIGLDRKLVRVCESMLMTRALGLDRRISFKLGDAAEMPFEDNGFDVVWIQGFPFQDRGAAGATPLNVLKESHRVLKKEGRLAMVCTLEVMEVLETAGFEVLYRNDAMPTSWTVKVQDAGPFEEGHARVFSLVARRKVTFNQ